MTLLIGALTLLSFVVGFLLFYLYGKDERELEKYFNDSYNEIKKKGYFLNKEVLKPIVIVDSGKRGSKIRVFLKMMYKKLFSSEEPQVIYVFGIEKEEERRAYMIQRAFALEWILIKLLDTEFIESAINYFAYKFGSNRKNMDGKTLYILRKDYESSRYRECISELDNVDFSGLVVINPPPIKKALLKELIMPMLLDQNNRIAQIPFSQRENLKSLFMKICNKIYQKYCGILFVGYWPEEKDYLSLISRSRRKFPCFLLCATGKHIPKLDRIFNKIENELLTNERHESCSLDGQFFYKETKYVDYKRVFIECIN